jgi:pimeloyl-ACP methyl ester carboxylesterase
MFKKALCYAVTLAMLFSCSFTIGAFASDYNNGCQDNEATFETLEETRVSSPAAVAGLETNDGKTFVSHPVLDDYPENTTYVYRSPNLYGGRAAARMNTNILVFAEQSFADKDAALAYLKNLGLIDIIDKAIGSVVLVTPSDPASGFTSADQKYYYELQTAMLAQKAYETNGDTRTYYSDAEYFGGYGYLYVIGIDGGSTFLNNYIANTLDYVGRIAGMLLIGGQMDVIRNVASIVPVYLVNATDDVIAKYRAADATDATIAENGKTTCYNQNLPLQKVVVAENANPSAAAYISDAYYSLFIKAMRVPVEERGLNSASSPYQGYGFDQAPYSLCDRNAVIDGVTEDGISVTEHSSDTLFADYATDDGAYLKTWFEYLPEEVLDGTAADGSVPLVLGLHGSGDDPRVFVDEYGLLEVAGRERLAVVAPEHQYISGEDREVELQALPALVKYMLATYPALDASRVYVMGYSMGGGATLKAIYGDPSLFAAATPMSPIPGYGSPYTPSDELLASSYNGVTIPVMFSTSGFDLTATFDQSTHGISSLFQTVLNRFVGLDGLANIDAFDFTKYPTSGFAADRVVTQTLNNEYENTTWYLNNADGVPMVALTFTEGLVHALYPEYGELAWNFVKHYSRNQETGEIEYDPYVD